MKTPKKINFLIIFLGVFFIFAPLAKGQDINNKYELLLKNRAELTQYEYEKAEKIMKEITMDEMSLVVEQKVLRQIDRVTNKKKNSLEKKYEEAYLKAHIDLYKNNQLLSFLRIQNTYAAGGNCDYDNRWPKFARAERKSGLRYTATGISRVKNDPNENPCDYRVHFNAKQWVTADGYDWIDYEMIKYHGGVNYSSSGDRVIVGYGSAVRGGNFNEWAVRHGIVMRNW